MRLRGLVMRGRYVTSTGRFLSLSHEQGSLPEQLRPPRPSARGHMLPAIRTLICLLFYFVPVHDLNGPKFDPHNDNIFWSWQNTLDRLTKLLSHGERVVVHCRGGLGRTGTFVAELLMRHGYNSIKAIKTVRAARPGAIETRAQLDYLLNHADLPSEPYAKRA